MTETPQAFFIEDGEAFVPTDAALGPWGPGLLHGGPLAALCVVLLERSSDPALRSVRLTAEYLRPPTQEPIEAKVREVRSGRRAEVRDVELWTRGKLTARASLLQLRPLAVPVPDQMRAESTSPPDTPDDYGPPAPSPVRTGPGIVGLGVEMRVRGARTMPGPGVVWMRTIIPVLASTPLSAMARAAVCGDFGNGLSGPPSESWPPPVAFMNADLDVRLLRTSDEEWIRIDARSAWTEDGVGVTRTELQDANGIVAVAQQSLALSPT